MGWTVSHPSEAHPQAVPVIHQGQLLITRKGGADKLLHNGRLDLCSFSRVAQQLLCRQQQVGVCVLGLDMQPSASGRDSQMQSLTGSCL